jgi:hypothetical protein
VTDILEDIAVHYIADNKLQVDYQNFKNSHPGSPGIRFFLPLLIGRYSRT